LDQNIDKTLWYGIKGTQSNELGPYLVLSEDQFEFEAKPENSKSFTINSSVNWSVSSSASWLNFDIASGSNNGSITISAEENTTVEERTAEITVSGDEVSTQKITVTQSAGAPFLDVSTYTIFLEAGAGSIDSFFISSNINWNISISQPWLNVNMQDGSNSQNIILTAEENFSLNKRRAVLMVTGNGAANRILTIEQVGASPFITLSPSTLTTNADSGSTATFNISSNTFWQISSSETWVSFDRNSGSGNASILTTVLGNDTTETRTSVITVSGQNVDTVRLTLTQNAGTPVSVSDIEQGRLIVFPNPSVNRIKFKNTGHDNFDLQIFDLTGKILFKGTASDNYQADIEKLGTGIFLYQATLKEKIYRGKIVFL
jgi:hypothetical protein